MPGHAHAAAAGKSTVIAGAYQALWNDLDLGHTVDGFALRQSAGGIDIMADITGETLIDAIHTGVNLSIAVTLEHWNAQAVEPMLWWFGDGTPANYEWGLTDGVGQRHWDAAKPLILYACHAVGFAAVDTDGDTTITPSTGAATANPYIDPLDIVFPKTLLRRDVDTEIAFTHRQRYLTLVLDIFPISNTYNMTDWDPVAPDQVERLTTCDQIRYFAATRGTPPA